VSPAAPEPTQLLQRASAGEPGAARELFGLVYGELVRIAHRLMDDERTEHTLQATALVHEAWIKLFQGEQASPWADRAHFLRTAATAMRRILVDHARGRGRAKRGDGKGRVLLDDVQDQLSAEGEVDLVALDDVLERFARIDPQGARVVELRYFAGLSIEETARALEVSTPTVERSWRAARLWLARALRDDGGSGP
jgi:RNA polymerase sigma factor (TIGR02999 family)